LALLLPVFVCLLAAPGSTKAAGFKVIANNSVDVDKLSKKDLSKLFLKKITKWGDDTSVKPVDLPVDSPIRDQFSRTIHEKTVPAVKAYWQQQIFAGRALPPTEKSSEEAVISYVRGTPGAIGYVSSDTDVKGVHVLTFE